MTASEKAALAAYGALSWLTAPTLCAHMLLRSTRDPGWRTRLPERWAIHTPRIPQGSIWLHASSLGEARALNVIAQELHHRRKDLPLLLTTFTPAGSTAIQRDLKESQFHCLLPLDLGIVNRRFLRKIRPALGVILETEIWPGLYAACRSAHVPLIIASARLTERSHARYRKVRPLISAALSAVSAVGAQSEEDARRFRSLGPENLNVQVSGNLKFHYRPQARMFEQGAQLRANIGPRRPVWIAASTHEPEEREALLAHQRLLDRQPHALLILAPRHRERFATVRAYLRQSGLKYSARSQDHAPDEQTQVFLLDSLGELNAFYAAADLAFVGGSIARVGGHNLLEPAAFGLPVLAGPHLFNTPETARRLSEAGALFTVRDAGELAGQAARLLGSEKARHVAGEAAWTCVVVGRGVLDRTLSLIEPFLPARKPTGSAPSSG